MKIAIDCRALRKSPSGIPNYIVSIINTLSKLNPTWQLYLLTNEKFNPELETRIKKNDNIFIIIKPLAIAERVAIVWFVFKLPLILNELKPDIFWSPSFFLPPVIPKGIKTILTIPDVVFKQFKHTMSLGNRLLSEMFYDKSIKKADMLWAISHYTKSEIENYFPKRKCKDIFVGLSINDHIFRKLEVSDEEKKALLKQFNIGEKLILFVGTLEPRKNLSFLLSLMPELAKQGYSLLVVGAKGWGTTHIKQIVEEPNFPSESVFFAGFITTDQLIKIYNIASIYVSTSQNEGFGLPQLEAMACGCPVVSPHNSAMIEVVEGAGETVKTWNTHDWVETINKVFNNREHYVQAGLLKAEDNKWDKIITRLTTYIYYHTQ